MKEYTVFKQSSSQYINVVGIPSLKIDSVGILTERDIYEDGTYGTSITSGAFNVVEGNVDINARPFTIEIVTGKEQGGKKITIKNVEIVSCKENRRIFVAETILTQ